jgi:hypothetical protein
MTRNTKIALGCGGAGCLGLIVVAIAGGVIYYLSQSSSNRNYNYNSNSNSNFNSNYNSSLNSNSDESSSSSLMTDDEKHRLFQAAGITKDNALILRVIRKLGFGDGTGSDYQEFVQGHFAWAMKNVEFIQSVNSEDRARAYVEAHIDD